MSIRKLYTSSLVLLLFLLGGVPAARGVDDLAFLEVGFHDAGSGILLYEAGPLWWDSGAWIVSGLPRDVMLDISVVGRVADGIARAQGGMTDLLIPSDGIGGLPGDPGGVILLAREGDGLRVLVGAYFDAGWFPLVPYEETLPLILDIKPGSDANPINVMASGVVLAVVAGTADFDILSLDPQTLTLAGVSLARYGYEDLVGTDDRALADGIPDAVLFFATRDVAGMLGDAAHGDYVELYLNGYTRDGVPVQGSDTVRVLRPAGGAKQRAKGKGK